MDINGLQKLTLLDFPGRAACTVFLAGCDLRCPFCHNSELWGPAPAVMDEEGLMAFLSTRRGLLEGVAFTGGEALLRSGLPKLISRVKELGFAVKLDTNGTHPNGLRELIEAGLIDYAAMDVKNDLERYALTCGLEEMDTAPVMQSISLLLEGRIPYEFRTTVVSPLHDEASFANIGRMIEGAENYFLQAFADCESVPYRCFSAPTEEEMHRYLEIVRPFVKHAEIRGM